MVSGLLGNEIDTHRLAQILRSDLPGVLAIADDVQQLPQYLFGIELWGGGGGRYGGHGSSLLGRLWRVWGDAGGCRQHAEPGQRMVAKKKGQRHPPLGRWGSVRKSIAGVPAVAGPRQH